MDTRTILILAGLALVAAIIILIDVRSDRRKSYKDKDKDKE